MAVENISGELLTPTSLGGLGGLFPLPIKARVSGLEEKKTVPTRRLMVLHRKVCWAAETP